jgi:chromosome segregation ATPase
MQVNRPYLDNYFETEFNLVNNYLSIKYPHIIEEIQMLSNMFISRVDAIKQLSVEVKNLEFLVDFNENTTDQPKSKIDALKTELLEAEKRLNAHLEYLDAFIEKPC